MEFQTSELEWKPWFTSRYTLKGILIKSSAAILLNNNYTFLSGSTSNIMHTMPCIHAWQPN